MQKIFGTAPVQTPTQQTTPGNIPATPTVTATPGNGTVPDNAQTNPATTADANASPLDAFKGLWDIDAKQIEANTPKPVFSIDHSKLAEAASKNDFSKVITPAMLEKINAGGPEAMQAMMSAMNAMSQKAFADSAFAATQMIEAATNKQRAEFESKLPSLIKNQSVSNSMREESPIFNHPATKPMLDFFQAQLVQKYPNATARELQDLSKQYLTNFAEGLAPQKKQEAKTNPGETDWGTFLS